MKGVSSVIAAILLLLITIVITGFAFIFFSRITEMPTAGAENQLASQQYRYSIMFQIESVSNNTVYIRNVGTAALTNLTFFVNNIYVNASGPDLLDSNDVGIYILDNTLLSHITNPSVLRISSIGWSSEIAAILAPSTASDTVPPDVSVSHSPESPEIGQIITITASATDNDAITSIVINLDSTNVKTCAASSPCIYTTSYSSSGSHTYNASANDPSGNVDWDPASGTKSFIVVDAVPPVISNTNVSTVTTNSAMINWTTDEASNSTVKYGRVSGNYNESNTDASFVTSHSVQLAGLLSSTIYYYVVNSSDASGNTAQSSEMNFTTATPLDTTPPVISNTNVSTVTSTKALINWTTDEYSTSVVWFGTAHANYTNSTTGADGTMHSVQLTGLSLSTTYYFVVNSSDPSGNTAQSSEYNFRTLGILVQGPLNGSTFASLTDLGGSIWSNPANAQTSNNSYTTSSISEDGSSNSLAATNFGFSIPTNATIKGIMVGIEKKASAAGSILDCGGYYTNCGVYLQKGGTRAGTDHSSGAYWPTADAYTNYGNSADLWGTTWTYADINSANFGIQIAAHNTDLLSSRTAYIDHIRITVYYTT